MAKKSLWDFYNDEPFMENPPLAIIGNPLRYRRKLSKGKYEYDYVKKAKKGRKVTKMATKRRRVSGGKKRSKSRKGKRNPFPMAGVVANPRRRRRAVYMRNPRRRHARRNPAILGVELPPLKQVAFAAAGFLAPPMVEGYINKWLPVSITSSAIGRYAVKVASVIGLSFLTKKAIGVAEARMVAIGGASYVLVSAVNEFMPSLTMSAYRGGMISAYHSGTINGYARPGLARNLPSLAAPIWGARNSSRIDSTGGVNVISQRLRRFQ